MRISTDKPLPPADKLVDILKREFGPHYKYKLFGLGEKTIIVQKSTFAGAQISLHKDSITVQGTPPFAGAGALTFLGLTELGAAIVPLFWLFGANPDTFRKVEKEITVFLQEKYG